MENCLKSLILYICNTKYNSPWLVTCHSSSRNCVSCMSMFMCVCLYVYTCICGGQRTTSGIICLRDLPVSVSPAVTVQAHHHAYLFFLSVDSGCWTQVLSLAKQALYQLAISQSLYLPSYASDYFEKLWMKKMDGHCSQAGECGVICSIIKCEYWKLTVYKSTAPYTLREEMPWKSPETCLA